MANNFSFCLFMPLFSFVNASFMTLYVNLHDFYGQKARKNYIYSPSSITYIDHMALCPIGRRPHRLHLWLLCLARPPQHDRRHVIHDRLPRDIDKRQPAL